MARMDKADKWTGYQRFLFVLEVLVSAIRRLCLSFEGIVYAAGLTHGGVWSLYKIPSYWMQDFFKGGSVATIVRENLRPHPFF